MPGKLLALSLWVVILLGVGSCAKPVISESFLDEAAVSPSFEMLLANPGGYLGRKVVLGGHILEVQNEENQTLIKVLQTPLDKSHRPQEEKESEGRFLVRVNRFLDPEVYSKNRLITVGGIVTGVAPEKVGDAVYNYPVIESRELYLWPIPEAPAYYYPPYYSPWPYYDPWVYGYYGWPSIYRRPFYHRGYPWWP